MDIKSLKLLLSQVKKISEHHEKVAKISGENFNIFRTLNIETSEVKTHSAFLAELLNPKGSDGQGDQYLKLFVEQFQIAQFDTKSAFTDVEKYTGAINGDLTMGGRIDILMTDKNNKHIIIENKIYAKDQENQLLRYYNFDKTAPLFYLTLLGDEPKEFSTGSESNKVTYKVISYKSDIVQWLNSCRRESVSLPLVRETITQYIHLIKHLTNQTEKDSMSNEIREFILNNLDYIESIELCGNELNSIVSETKSMFERFLGEVFASGEIIKLGDISIKAAKGEDGSGVYFGYQSFDGNENISGSEKVKHYSQLLKQIHDGFYSNSNWLGWYNPGLFKGGKRFSHLDKKIIIKMYTNHDYLVDIVKELVAKDRIIRDTFVNELN